MKIAFLTSEYPHPKTSHSGGLGTSIKNLAQALVKQKVEVIIFLYGQKSNEIFTEDGIKFYFIKDKKYSFAKWYFYRKHIQNYINKVINSEKIDILEAPDWTGITALMKFKIPLIIRFHGSDTYFCHLENRKQKLKNYWFEKLAIKGASAYIAPTNFAGELSKKLFNIKNKEVKTIHYGLELEKFQNSNPGIFDKGLIIYIGTIIRKKGVFELPEIFKNVRINYPQAKLILIGGDSSDIQTGSNSTWELIKNQFAKDDLQQVNYIGKIPYNEVQQHIKNATVCIFPTFAETLGMVTIESMAMQKPVVNSNFGWCKELIDDGVNGFLVNPKEHGNFANAIVELLNNNQLHQSIREKALQTVEKKFSIHKTVIQNIDFYSKISNKAK